MSGYNSIVDHFASKKKKDLYPYKLSLRYLISNLFVTNLCMTHKSIESLRKFSSKVETRAWYFSVIGAFQVENNDTKFNRLLNMCQKVRHLFLWILFWERIGDEPKKQKW